MNKTLPHPDTRQTAEEYDAVFDRRSALVMQAVDTYHEYLLHYLTGLTRHEQDAEDLLQTLYRHVLLHFKEEHIGSLGILRRKAKQIFIDQYRYRQRRNEQLTDSYAGIEPHAKPYEPETPEEEAEMEANFWAEFPGIELTKQQRQCIWLHARYSYSYTEIAEQLGIGKSTVGDAVAVARQAIKASLETQNNH